MKKESAVEEGYGWGRRRPGVRMEIPSPQIPFREALHIFKVSIVFVS